MKEIIIPGFFPASTCKKIKDKMDGKTFMNFEVFFSNCCGNCSLIVRGEAESEQELQEMFFHCALNLLAA